MRSVRLNSDTPAFRFQVWASFLIASLGTSAGIVFLDVDIWVRAFLGLGLWFTISSCMSLAKAVRDQHESEKITHKLDEAQAEAILREMNAETDLRRAA